MFSSFLQELNWMFDATVGQLQLSWQSAAQANQKPFKNSRGLVILYL